MIGVIGIDPSLSSSGFCWGETQGSVLRTSANSAYRLDDIFEEATYRTRVLKEVHHGSALAVIEDLPANAKSAGLTGQAQGVIRLALCRAEVPFITVPPASLKKFATGKGNAKKEDMAKMLGFQKPAQWDDNVIDAYWLRRMGLEYLANFAQSLHMEHFGKKRELKWKDIPWTEGVFAA